MGVLAIEMLRFELLASIILVDYDEVCLCPRGSHLTSNPFII